MHRNMIKLFMTMKNDSARCLKSWRHQKHLLTVLPQTVVIKTPMCHKVSFLPGLAETESERAADSGEFKCTRRLSLRSS